MRFGKKLAIQVSDDLSDAPYLSHKLMKDAINNTVAELRIYQSRQSAADFPGAGFPEGLRAPGVGPPQPEELAVLEARISEHDQQFFGLVELDLAQILGFVRRSEAHIEDRIAELQQNGLRAGVLVDEEQLQHLERSLPFTLASRTELCQQLVELRLASGDPGEVARQMLDFSKLHNELVHEVNKHTQYLEINVAGFRKLLKRHEKQIPRRFHTRATPFLDFHRIVTHSSTQLVDIARQLCEVVADAWRRLAGHGISVYREPLLELKGLGAECKMVLEIQRQLKAPMLAHLKQLPSDT